MVKFEEFFTVSSSVVTIGNEKTVPVAILNKQFEDKVISNLFTDGLLEKFTSRSLSDQLNGCKLGFYRDGSADDNAEFPKVCKSAVSSNWSIAEKLENFPIEYALATKNNLFLGVVLYGQILWLGCQIRYLVTKISAGDNNGAGYKGDGETYEDYDYKNLLFNPSFLIADVFFKDETLKNATVITVPEGVERIDHNAFSGFDKLEKVILPSTLTQIGRFAFDNCHSLKEINIPNGIKEISYGAFKNCSTLEEILLPNSVKSIDNSAFGDCISLKKITLPISKIRIGSYAFNNCVSLEEVVNSTSILGMSDHSFDCCKALKKFTLSEDFSGSISQFCFCNCQSLKSFSVPKNTFQVSSYAFSGCSSLEEIIIPETVSLFNGNALYGCPNLKRIIISKEFKSELEENIDLSTIETIEYL